MDVPFAAGMRDNRSCCCIQAQMGGVNWLQVGVALGVSLPLLVASRARAQDWCADEAKIKERLEKGIEDFGEITLFRECDRLAVPTLIAIFKNPKSSIRERATVALGYIDAEAKDTVPTLIDALKDRDLLVRSSAANTLGNIRTDATDAVPALIAALKDPNSYVRGSAAYALGNISVDIEATDAKGAVPALVAALKDKDSDVRASAAYALGLIVISLEVAEVKDVVPALIETLKDENSGVRGNAATALGNIGPDAKDAVPALIKAFKYENSYVRNKAASALGSIGVDAKSAVPVLIEALKDENSNVRGHAASALGSIGADAKDVVPVLIKALKDENADVRWKAAFALRGMETETQDIIPALVEALQDRNPIVGRNAAEALEIIVTDIYDAAESLEQLSQAEKITTKIQQALKDAGFKENHKQVNRLLAAIKGKQTRMQRDRWFPIARNVWLSHLLVWALLIFAYPRSRQIQTLFFWNPWIRRITGLWYVGLLLAWVPWLRAKLFAPFKETLLAAAELDRFDTQDYFAEVTVLLRAVNQTQPLQEAIPQVKGQIVLEGESGLGKSMFLRSLARKSKRLLVYLNASHCTAGVMAAIQAKLHGPARDPKFLRDLIYSGALDICIDGLNEVSADTRATITEFVERHFKGNIILATQPLEWTPPATAKICVLQPLKRSQIEAFLMSRQASLGTAGSASKEAYGAACRAYLLQALDEGRPPELLRAVERILSNPMDLTLVAQMLAVGETPDLLGLQRQQYELMAAEYERTCLLPFPLEAFSERVYQLRLADEAALAEAEFPAALRCLGRYKMMMSRQDKNRSEDRGEGQAEKPMRQWYFRHDKIMEFFVVQTFLGENNPRTIDHIDDPRFRGVYFLLVNLMPLPAARQLREALILYAAKTKDHTVSDTFVQLFQERDESEAGREPGTAGKKLMVRS